MQVLPVVLISGTLMIYLRMPRMRDELRMMFYAGRCRCVCVWIVGLPDNHNKWDIIISMLYDFNYVNNGCVLYCSDFFSCCFNYGDDVSKWNILHHVVFNYVNDWCFGIEVTFVAVVLIMETMSASEIYWVIFECCVWF